MGHPVRVFVIGLWIFLNVQSGFANAPTRSMRPVPRGGTEAAFEPRQTGVQVYFNAKIRPKPRPQYITEFTADEVKPIPIPPLGPPRSEQPARPDFMVLLSDQPGVKRSPRPMKRPANLRRATSARNQSNTIVATSRAGSVCGDRAIRGQKVARIRGRIAQCGIANPVRVTEISGVKLTQASLMNCETARALKTWIVKGAKPAVGRRGGGIKSLKILAHYACRTRNNQPGAKISEHGKGKAIDIGAINLKNGTSISVLRGWNDRRDGKILRRMHRAACGPFGVVLGPDANKYHKDHFHFDTAHYSKPYCR